MPSPASIGRTGDTIRRHKVFLGLPELRGQTKKASFVPSCLCVFVVQGFLRQILRLVLSATPSQAIADNLQLTISELHDLQEDPTDIQQGLNLPDAGVVWLALKVR